MWLCSLYPGANPSASNSLSFCPISEITCALTVFYTQSLAPLLASWKAFRIGILGSQNPITTLKVIHFVGTWDFAGYVVRHFVGTFNSSHSFTTKKVASVFSQVFTQKYQYYPQLPF